MSSRRKSFGLALVVLAATLLATPAFAGSTTVNGVTLTWPDYPLSAPGTGTALMSCEPWNSAASSITFTGVPTGATVTVNFGWFDPTAANPLSVQPGVQFNNVTGGTLTVAVPYPTDTDTWPGFVEATNERSIGLTAFAVVTSSGANTKLTSGKWWVRCAPPPPPPPDEGEAGGCTPGYWKQPHHLDSWVGYLPTNSFNTVFGVTASFNPSTLLDALWLGGGGQRALARHAVAALLNAARTDYSYTFTQAEIIAGVQSAFASGDYEPFKDLLDRANNTGCPLN
jgi:hypothetical protein